MVNGSEANQYIREADDILISMPRKQKRVVVQVSTSSGLPPVQLTRIIVLFGVFQPELAGIVSEKRETIAWFI